MQVLKQFPIKNITNICGRVLQGSEPFEGAEDTSMDEMVMPCCRFDNVNIVGPYIQSSNCVFKRIPGKVLFSDDGTGQLASLNDINQGMIGDCWFLSAIDFTVNHPKYKDCISSIVQPTENGVKVTLYNTDSAEWQTAYLDTRTLVNGDYIPTTISVLSSDPREIWPAMLEKGLAKMCGGYKNIEGGFMSEGMSFLHGGRGWFISSKDIVPRLLSGSVSIDALVIDLKMLWDAGYGVFTAWEQDMLSDVRAKGLVNGHAYSILDMKKIKDEWVFKLKNPWGKFEWNGRYSDTDHSEEACEVRKEFNMQSKEDGIFLMSAFDLFGRCEGIDIFEPLDMHILSGGCTPGGA